MASVWLRRESNSESRLFGYTLFFRTLTLLIAMTDTNPPQERGATDPKEERRRQLMAALTRPVSDETNDSEWDDGGRVRLSEAEGERRGTAYRQYLAMRRPLLPSVRQLSR